VVLEIAAVGFNNATGAKVFEYTGEFTPGLQGGFWTHAVDRVQHLILPSLTLILGEIAIFSRYQRSAMLDVLGQDFVRTAQAKGLRRRGALLRHALRTALIPAVTYFIYSFGISSSARPSRRRSSAGTAWESGSWTPSLPRTRTRSAVHKNLANVGSYGFAQPDYTKIGFMNSPS